MMNLAADSLASCALWVCCQVRLGRAAVFCAIDDSDTMEYGNLYTLPLTPTTELRIEREPETVIGIYDPGTSPDAVRFDLSHFWLHQRPGTIAA